MFAENDHATCVDAWIETTTSGLPSELLLRLFEQALGALWRRADLTLGEVTLTAIVDRVLYTAAEKYPVLSSLEVEPGGILWSKFHERADELDASELMEAFRFILVQFLTILGNLTAEILTSALQSELAKVKLQGASMSNGDRKSGPRARSKGSK